MFKAGQVPTETLAGLRASAASAWERLWEQLVEARAFAEKLGRDVSVFDQCRLRAASIWMKRAEFNLGAWTSTRTRVGSASAKGAPVVVDLVALLSLEPKRIELEWFIGCCLFEGGIWESPRTSDGIHGIERVLERGPDVLRVRGRIWEIDQSLHMFSLELKRDGSGDRFTWSLHFDAIDDRAEDIEWRVTLVGGATVQDNALAIVAGSVRTSVRELSEPESLEPQGRHRRSRRSGRGEPDENQEPDKGSDPSE